MRISTFKENFTKDLESFVKSPMQIACLTEWNPQRVASPERHLALGKNVNLTVDVQIYTLEKENQAFDNISSLLRIYLDRTILRSLPKLDPVKEQVWMFAQKWFSEYYDLLTEPEILKSTFFRTCNDDFLSLMAKMLDVQPKQRISFLQALEEWDPANPLLRPLTEPQQIDLDIEESPPIQTQEKCITPICQATTSEIVSSSLPATSVPSKVSWTPLVLNGLYRSEGHNKTRKNLHN